MADYDKNVKEKDKDYAQSFRSLLKSHGLDPSKDMPCLWCGQPTMHFVENAVRTRILCTKCKHSANLYETIATFNRNRHKTDNSNDATLDLFQPLDSLTVDNKNSIERNEIMKNDILPSTVEVNSARIHFDDANADSGSDSDVDANSDLDDLPFDQQAAIEKKEIQAIKGNQFFNPDGIHFDLKRIDQWVVAINKIPQRLHNGKLIPANANDPKNWLPFKQAAEIAIRFDCQVGFALNVEEGSFPFVGIDIDHCIDDDGNFNETATNLIHHFNGRAYVEKSSSERGVHIIFSDSAAPALGTRKNKFGVEFYSVNRFFVLTGKNIGALPVNIDACGQFNLCLAKVKDVLNDAVNDMTPQDIDAFLKPRRKTKDLSPAEIDQLDKKIIERIRKSKSASKFSKLFDHGDCSDYVEEVKDNNGNVTGTRIDHSRADFALLSIIAWRTDDPDQIARIFSMAPKFKDAPKVLGKRDKWKDREDYRLRSITKVLISQQRLIHPVDSPFNADAFKSDIKRDLRYSKNGIPIADTKNFELVFQNDHNIKDLLRWNLFTQKIELTRLPNWRKDFERNLPWQDFDDYALQNYIDREYGLHGKDVFFRVVNDYARKQSFHPVQDFLNHLPKWDGKKRAETLFIDHLGAVDNPYNRAVARQWLLAAISRVFNPACKFDFCLTLQGKQGIGKSTLLSLLGGKWFGELDSLQGKDAIDKLQGLWIVELVEMQATKRADNEQIKSFLSTQKDRARLSYDRRTSEFYRQCVFAASTNDKEFLKDQTGGRRFWIVECRNKDFNLHLSKDDILQIWAEVYHRYQQLFANSFDSSLLDLPVDVKADAVEIQSAHTDGADAQGQIAAFLNKPIPKYEFWRLLTKEERKEYFRNGGVVKLPLKRLPLSMQDKFFNDVSTDDFGEKRITIDSNIRTKDSWKFYFDTEHDGKRQKVSAVEILYELFDGERSKLTTRRIADLMRNLDGWQEKQNAVVDPEYGRQRTSFIRITN